MPIRPEVTPFIVAALLAGGVTAVVCIACRVSGRKAAAVGGSVALVLSAFLLHFFRDPSRTPPEDPSAVVAGAEGRIDAMTTLSETDFFALMRKSGLQDSQLAKLEAFRNDDVLRISIFLSLFDVHVNRAPIEGEAVFLGYFPGKHYFAFTEKSSEHNAHNAILISGEHTACLIHQIVGPVGRRVVYWPSHDRSVHLAKGDRIGMMKFASRLDMYFPESDLAVAVTTGTGVRAGETVVGRLRTHRSEMQSWEGGTPGRPKSSR